MPVHGEYLIKRRLEAVPSRGNNFANDNNPGWLSEVIERQLSRQACCRPALDARATRYNIVGISRVFAPGPLHSKRAGDPNIPGALSGQAVPRTDATMERAEPFARLPRPKSGG